VEEKSVATCCNQLQFAAIVSVKMTMGAGETIGFLLERFSDYPSDGILFKE
jgi:hypothetical protein